MYPPRVRLESQAQNRFLAGAGIDGEQNEARDVPSARVGPRRANERSHLVSGEPAIGRGLLCRKDDIQRTREIRAAYNEIERNRKNQDRMRPQVFR